MSSKSNEIRSVAFVSLGCPKNLVDSERMLGLLAQDGLALTPDAGAADAIIINTCGFLEASKEESLGEIRRAVSMKGVSPSSPRYGLTVSASQAHWRSAPR